MDAGVVIYSRLAGTGITAAENRIYPLILPQEPTYPALAYSGQC